MMPLKIMYSQAKTKQKIKNPKKEKKLTYYNLYLKINK